MAEKNMFTIPNQVAQRVTERIPWEFSPNVPEQMARTKREYQAWRSQPSTQHCMYSCMEGAVKGMRISVDNPIVKIHGIIADYDTVISDELVNASILNCKGEFRPNWVHHTPHSGGRRLVWMFETPALVAGNDMARLFCIHAAKKLKAKNYLAGLDAEALGNPTIYYDVGSEWRELDAARVPENFVFAWLFDVGAQADRPTFPGPVIPLKDIQKEMDDRFPGVGRVSLYWVPRDHGSGTPVLITPGPVWLTGSVRGCIVSRVARRSCHGRLSSAPSLRRSTPPRPWVP